MATLDVGSFARDHQYSVGELAEQVSHLLLQDTELWTYRSVHVWLKGSQPSGDHRVAVIRLMMQHAQRELEAARKSDLRGIVRAYGIYLGMRARFLALYDTTKMGADLTPQVNQIEEELNVHLAPLLGQLLGKVEGSSGTKEPSS